MAFEGPALVVGTAGHVDHGKTSLVRRLTGVDLDVLPEEKERGITVALGFAPYDVPGGGRVAFVDVPGHERLVRTMIAGAAGIDAALLCVSAVEGVMPQTREHLAILGLLGVRQGAVVMTMADLVEPDWLALAIEEVREALVGTSLEGAPIVPFSSVTGAGVEAVDAALAGFGRAARDPGGPLRMPVDRVFVQTGFGTVVTGTLWSGSVREGQAVAIAPGGQPARVRGVQVHGVAVAEARAGWRAALNLSGIEAESIERGAMIVSGPVPGASVVDVRYRHVASTALADEAPVRVLLGTSEAGGRLHLAADRDAVAPGEEVWAQVRLDAPLPAAPGDRFVVRRASPAATLGGGVVVDPWATRMRRRDRVAWGRQIARLAAGDRAVWLERGGESGLAREDWEARGGVGGAVLGDRVFAPPVVARLEGVLLDALAAWHEANPLAPGVPRRDLRRDRLVHLSERGFDALLGRLVDAGVVVVDGPLARLATFRVALDDGRKALRDGLLATIAAAGLAGVGPADVAASHPGGDREALVRLLVKEGRVVEIPGIGWVASAARNDLAARLRAWFAAHERLSPGEFKEMTGLSRKTAIPWLEWLDQQRWTKRIGDARARGPAL